MPRHPLLIALSLLATTAHVAVAQQTASRSQFVVKKGKDTVAIEMFSRDRSTLTSEIYQSNGVRTQYTADLRSDHTIKHVEMTRQGRQGAGGTVSVTFGDSIVSAVASAGGDGEKFEFVSHGRATPFLAISFALAEQIILANRLDIGKSTRLVAVRLAAGDSTTVTLERFHSDSVSLVMPDLRLTVALSAAGEVIGGRNVAQGWVVERKPVSGKP